MPLVNLGIQTDEIPFLYKDASSTSSTLQAKSNLPTNFSSIKLINASKQKSHMSRRLKKCLCFILFFLGFGFFAVFYVGYVNPGYSHILMGNKFKVSEPLSTSPHEEIQYGKPIPNTVNSGNIPSFEDVVSKDFLFNIEGHDVMVFLHIQKTGGTTFGKHLVKDLELERECVCHRRSKKRCTCLRPGINSDETWLFSRYSTGWKCGLHADWTELTACVDDAMDKIDDNSVKRRYFYITFLRDPLSRYLSEFRHVQRGATWKKSLLFCNGRSATREEVPLCYDEPIWSNVTIEDFVNCESNLAHNRQTRMLADLTLIDCYNKSKWTRAQRDTILLASAKNNLERMAFFGLTEFQEISQYLFEETFNLKFNVRFMQHNDTNANDMTSSLNKKLYKQISQMNNLDLELYEFAKELLYKRYRTLKSMDPHFEEHFQNMGHNTQFSWDKVDRDR